MPQLLRASYPRVLRSAGPCGTSFSKARRPWRRPRMHSPAAQFSARLGAPMQGTSFRSRGQGRARKALAIEHREQHRSMMQRLVSVETPWTLEVDADRAARVVFGQGLQGSEFSFEADLDCVRGCHAEGDCGGKDRIRLAIAEKGSTKPSARKQAELRGPLGAEPTRVSA